MNINGTRTGSINLTLDGVSSLDTGSLTGPYLAPSIDAVAEVKVLLSNYRPSTDAVPAPPSTRSSRAAPVIFTAAPTTSFGTRLSTPTSG